MTLSDQRSESESIDKQLKSDHTKMTVPNRVKLINNAFIEAKNDNLEYDTVFDLTEYSVNERDYLPWHDAMGFFFSIKTMVTSTARFGLFQTASPEFLSISNLFLIFQ